MRTSAEPIASLSHAASIGSSSATSARSDAGVGRSRAGERRGPERARRRRLRRAVGLDLHAASASSTGRSEARPNGSVFRCAFTERADADATSALNRSARTVGFGHPEPSANARRGGSSCADHVVEVADPPFVQLDQLRDEPIGAGRPVRATTASHSGDTSSRSAARRRRSRKTTRLFANVQAAAEGAERRRRALVDPLEQRRMIDEVRERLHRRAPTSPRQISAALRSATIAATISRGATLRRKIALLHKSTVSGIGTTSVESPRPALRLSRSAKCARAGRAATGAATAGTLPRSVGGLRARYRAGAAISETKRRAIRRRIDAERLRERGRPARHRDVFGDHDAADGGARTSATNAATRDAASGRYTEPYFPPAGGQVEPRPSRRAHIIYAVHSSERWHPRTTPRKTLRFWRGWSPSANGPACTSAASAPPACTTSSGKSSTTPSTRR